MGDEFYWFCKFCEHYVQNQYTAYEHQNYCPRIPYGLGVVQVKPFPTNKEIEEYQKRQAEANQRKDARKATRQARKERRQYQGRHKK